LFRKALNFPQLRKMMNNWKKNLRERFERFFWHGFWTDPAVFFSLVLALLVNLSMWIATWRIVQPTDLPIILHYNVFFGVDSVGDWKNVFLMPTLAAAIFVVNVILSRFFYYKERMASYLFAGMALAVQLLMAIGLGSIILINY
jgi:hypothetical protein